MRSRYCAVVWLLGIALFTWTLQAGSPAQAGGLKITGGGIKTLGDPFYEYIVEVSLLPGFEFETGDSFTLYKLPGVNQSSFYNAPIAGNPVGPWAGSPNNSGDIEFALATPFNSPPFANPGPGNKFTGQFTVLTAMSLPTLPPHYSLTVDWTAKIHDINGNPVNESGSFVLTVIPEPTSIILLGLGCGLPIAYHLRRKRSGRA